MQSGRKTWKARAYTILEAGKTGDLPSAIFDWSMVALILANVVAFAAETVPSVEAAYGPQLDLFNMVSVLIFTAEYILRLWVCEEHPHLRHHHPFMARLRFAATPALLIDLIVILPFYLSFLFAMDLRVLRVLRLLRFMKLARFSPALSIMGRVLYHERRALYASFLIMMGMLVLSATAMYLVEREVQPEAFGTVPAAMWWAMATLTTVGYGDVVPITELGRVIGGVVMLMGLGLFALPIGIIATGFAQEIHRTEFIVTWGMVARVPLFRDLDATSIAEIMTILRTQVAPAGSVIVRRGDVADTMYFITAGEVDVILEDRAVRLSEGDFFGEIALLRDVTRVATVRARTRCHLMVIEAVDFKVLLSHNERLAARVNYIADRRLTGEWTQGDMLEEELHPQSQNPE